MISTGRCHTAQETIQMFHAKFPDRVICRFGDQDCDLVPLHDFLLGQLKQMVYADKLNIIPKLKDEIVQKLPQEL